MRTLWNTVSFLALVNLIAVGLFVGWLGMTDRLSLDRIHEVRQTFAPTVTEVDATAEREAKLESDALQEAADVAKENDPSFSTPTELNVARLVRRQEEDLLQHVQDFANERRAELAEERARLQADQAAFEAAKQAWELATADERTRKTDVQFGKVVKLYETSAPDSVRQWIKILVEDGETDRVVAYLDAMKATASKKVLATFEGDDLRLATELLERLSTLGVPGDSEKFANADDSTLDAPSPGPGQ